MAETENVKHGTKSSRRIVKPKKMDLDSSESGKHKRGHKRKRKAVSESLPEEGDETQKDINNINSNSDKLRNVGSKDKNPSLKMRIVNVQSLEAGGKDLVIDPKEKALKKVTPPSHVCDRCDHRFKTKMAYNLHQVKVHKEFINMMCSWCGRQFNLQHDLDIHNIFVCKKVKRRYECKACNLDFTTSEEKSKHPCTSDSKKPLYCLREDCTFKAKTVNALSEHLSRHLGIKQYLCGTCGNSFAAKKDLDRHMDIHKDSKDNVCQDCGKSYKCRHALRSHIRKHTHKDRYKCENCPYTSALYNCYKQHMLKHKKPTHKCPTCGKYLRSMYSLNQHIRSRHTLDRIFTCKFCDFTTNKGPSYASHMKKHKDMKDLVDSEADTVDEDQINNDPAATTPGFASPLTYFSISSNKQPTVTPTQLQRMTGNILTISTDSPHRTILGDPSLHYDDEVNITGQNADALMANIVSSAEGHEISMIPSEAAGATINLYSTETTLPSLILSESMASISTEENWSSNEQASGNMNC